MILFTNGCSWTYGGGLNLDHPVQAAQRLSSVWPHHLGSALGADQVVNLAAGCGSNQRTVRTTYNWVLSQPKEVLEQTVAIIQITEPSRYELHIPKFEGDTDGWIKCKVGVVTADEYRKDLSQLHWDYNNTRLSLYHDLESAYSVLTTCESLSSLFNRFRIRHYFWGAEFFDYKESFVPKDLSTYFENNFNWITKDRWQYDRVAPYDQHPSIEGHKQIAKLMFDNI